MNIIVLKIITILFTAALITSCVSFGERFLINTKSPTEDYLVQCKKSHDYLIGHNASSYTAVGKAFITKSGEEESCDFIISGYNSRAYISHPTFKHQLIKGDNYVNYKVDIMENGTKVNKFVHWKERNKKALEIYKSGYWNSRHDPIKEYLSKISSCYISKEYLEVHNKNNSLNYKDLKNKYYTDILECNRENERIRHKHERSSDFFYYGRQGRYNEALMQCLYNRQSCREKKEYLPDRAILARNDYMWGRKIWDPYLQGSDAERDKLIEKRKTTFIVGYGLGYIYHKDGTEDPPDMLAGWLLIDARTKQEILETYKGYTLTVFDSEPTELTEYKKERYLKGCDGTILHLDVDTDKQTKELSTFIYNTAQGIKTSYCQKQ